MTAEKGGRALERRADVDWVRTASMLGVIFLHASSGFVSRPSRFSLLGMTPALLCNQAARFSVPVFFLLSGLGLGLSRREAGLPGFWLRRIRRSVLPYVLWSAFYFLQSSRFRLSALLSHGGLRAFGRLLLTGGAASHLWFLPVLLQLYLLYPALKKCVRAHPLPTLVLSFLISLYCTLVIYVPLPFPPWWRPRLWRLFPVWLFYFTLGMALTGERLERISADARKHAAALCLLALAAALAYTADARRSGDLDSIKPQLFLYGPLCFLAILASWKWVGGIRGVGAISAFLARHSMTLYFSHIFFLGLLRRIAFFQRNAGTMLLMGLLVAALSALAALLPEGAARWAGRLSNRAP